MNHWKKGGAVTLVLLIVLSIAGGIWYFLNYQRIGLHFYPRHAERLDLREENLAIAQYEKLHNKMPDTEILWNIPFQGNTYSQDTRELRITTLTQQDVDALRAFPVLRVLDARGCQEYGLLQAVQAACPNLEVRYTVTIGGREYPQDTQLLHVDGITEQELSLLSYLPQLRQVCLETGKNPEQLTPLMELCAQRQIPVQVVLNMQYYDTDITELTVTGIQSEEMALIYLLPQLQQVRFLEPAADAESLLAYAITHPDTDVRWEKTILGVLCTQDMEQLDLTAALSPEGALAYEQAAKAPVQGTRDPVPYLFKVNAKYPLADRTSDTAALIRQVEEGLRYFPNIKTVFLGGCHLDNEVMAAFREAHREDYKVVWSVQMGDKVIARTDTPYFMPTKFHTYYFLDRDSENLKYCEDILCVDLGHMAITDISWVTAMPKLRYLVLAHTQLQYIEPIRSCKNLRFLELDWSPIRDYSPLQDCTALEDLNIGMTYADITPVCEMTWLQHLWMVNCNSGSVSKAAQALPDTRILGGGSATVAGGWRSLPNYYAMRDCMGMFYMPW